MASLVAAHCVELISLASTNPDECLAGIKDFMHVSGSFEEGTFRSACALRA